MVDEASRAARSPTGRARWWVLGVGIVLPIAAAMIGIKLLQFRAMAKAGAEMVMPPEPVNVADVREENWQPRIAAVGSVVAVKGALVATEADGIVRKISFEAGSDARAGAELLRLDVEIEEAQLREAEATAESARSYLARVKEAAATGSVAATELDSADARAKQAEARLDNIRATIAKKVVRAPFSGKLGIRQVSVGQYLAKGSPVVSLQAMDPIFVEFSLPQQRIGEIAEGLQVDVGTDSYPGQPFQGRITAINPDIDPATRNVRVQATLANPGAKLRPGMFVSAEVTTARSERVLFIPASAVLNAPFGDSVFVVEEQPAASGGQPSLVVQQRFVRLGTRQGDFVAAIEGLKAGERVVSTGAFKLRPGMPVVIDNSLAPDFKFSPSPKNT